MKKKRLSKKQKIEARAKRLWKRYGITLDQYEKAYVQQEGKCAICLRPAWNKRLMVDHDHKPPHRVRGLLDFLCNHRLLGRGLERPELHERAVAYLRSDFDVRRL